MRITVELLEDSSAVFSQGKYENNSDEWKENNYQHWTRMANFSLQVGHLCTDGRTWSHCRQSPKPAPMQHRETDRRQLRETESKIFQTGFSHFTEGLVKGKKG